MKKMNQFKKEKDSKLQKIIIQLIWSTLQCQKSIRLGITIQIALLFICNLQMLFFVLYTNFSWQENQNLSTYQLILMIIFRMDMFISTFENTKKFVIYIIFVIILAQKVTLFYFYHQQEKLEGPRKKSRIIQYLIGAYVQLYYNLFLIPFSTLASGFIGYQYSQLKVNDLNYIQLLFGIMIFICIQMEAIYHILISEQSIDTKIISFEKIKIASKEFIIYILNLAIIIIVTTITDTQLLQWILYLLVFLSDLLTIQNQLETSGIIHISKKQIMYFCHCLSIIYVIYSSIKLLTQSTQFNPLQYTAISFPILLHIILSIDIATHKQQFYGSLEKKHLNIFSLTLLLMQIENEVTFPKIHKIYIFNQHCNKCHDPHCFCHHHELVVDTKDTAPISVEIEKEFTQTKLKLIRKLLFETNGFNLTDIQYYTITYGVLLANFGWVIQAVKHFNQVIFGRTQSSKNTQQSINQTILGANSYSATLINDSSSQTDPEKKFAEVTSKNKRRLSKHIMTFSLQLDFIERQRVTYLLNEIKLKLKNVFGGQQLTEEQHELSEHIQTFMQQELKMEYFLQQITTILKSKIKFFEISLQQLKDRKASEQMRSIQIICRQLMLFQHRLKIEYENYPSKRLLSLRVFFEAEVFRNYLEAYRLVNQATMSEDKFIVLNSNFSINFYSNSISYLLFSVDDDLQNVEILQHSSNLKRMIDYSLNDELYFHELLLQYIQREHPILVSRFFKMGKSKFYKQFNQSFIKTKKGIAKSIILSLDNISQFQCDKIVIIGLIQELEIQQSFLMVDVNLILGGMTKSFLYMLGFNSALIDQINDFSLFYRTKIFQIFPSFEEWVKNEEQVIKINSAETYFMDLELYLGEVLAENAHTFLSQQSLQTQLWGNQSYLRQYQSNLTIYQNELYGYHYYTVQIESIIQNQTFQSYGKNTDQGQIQEYHKRTLTGESGDFQISQLNLSIDEGMPRTVNQFTIKSREGYSQNTQRNASIDKNKNLFDVQELYQDDIMEKIEFLQQQVLSPNKSTSQLIERQQNKLLQQSSQQYYFTNITSQKQIKALQSVELNNAEIRANNKQVELVHRSKKSTELGISSSELQKKFELFNLFTKDKEPQKLKLILSLIFLVLIIQSICPILVILILNEDILLFISDIEIISLHASIQGPHDLFFSMRNTITSYQLMQKDGFISASLATNLTEPYYQHIGLGYSELKASFITQLNNKYLEYFLDDKQMVIRYMKDNDTQIYEFASETFRECLFIMLQYQFGQMRTFQKRGSTTGQPYQVFLFANYYNVQDKLEEITNAILTYSKDRSISVGQKWVKIWSIFIVLMALSVIVVTIVYNLYLKQYDKLLQLLQYLDKQKVLQEVEKLTQLIRLMNSNQDSACSYKLDIARQENIMDKEIEINKIQKVKKNADEEELYGLPRMASILFWILISLIFICYSLIIELRTTDYLSKYDDTAGFYFMIQNLKFRSGAMYMYREHLFRFSSLTYLTAYDKQRLYLLVSKAQDNIQEYLSFVSSFQPEKYLLSDSFIKFFREQQTTNLCNYIEEDYANWMQLYCEKAFEGQILKGSIAALNYISNNIRNQQAINNFTKRVEVQLYELEGGQLILRAFFKVSSEFQIGIQDITRQENNFVLIITIIFTIYLAIFLFIVIYYFRPTLISEYSILRRMIFLMPADIMLGDETFERYLRVIIVSQGLK